MQRDEGMKNARTGRADNTGRSSISSFRAWPGIWFISLNGSPP